MEREGHREEQEKKGRPPRVRERKEKNSQVVLGTPGMVRIGMEPTLPLARNKTVPE
jgi:hypothetical protein